MKKRILASALVVALSFQAVYPMVEGMKEKGSQFGAWAKKKGSSVSEWATEKAKAQFALLSSSEKVKQAEVIFGKYENLRCLRHGDNCSKIKRFFLAWVASVILALVTAGTVFVGYKGAQGGKFISKKLYKSLKDEAEKFSTLGALVPDQIQNEKEFDKYIDTVWEAAQPVGLPPQFTVADVRAIKLAMGKMNKSFEDLIMIKDEQGYISFQIAGLIDRLLRKVVIRYNIGLLKGNKEILDREFGKLKLAWEEVKLLDKEWKTHVREDDSEYIERTLYDEEK